MAFFGAKSAGAARLEANRTLRNSSGWAQMRKHLANQGQANPEGLRVLDIGPTSAGNINFITTLGHSIYMANLVEDAARPEYGLQNEAHEALDPPELEERVERFLSGNLDFAGRTFDVVTLWDTADYLPPALLEPVIRRIHKVMAPGGQILAFFHSKLDGADTVFSRYHLSDTDQVEIQRIGLHPIRQTLTNRQIETLFRDFAGYKFFLAKDTLREVVVTR